MVVKEAVNANTHYTGTRRFNVGVDSATRDKFSLAD
jgi:hypothetical protein